MAEEKKKPKSEKLYGKAPKIEKAEAKGDKVKSEGGAPKKAEEIAFHRPPEEEWAEGPSNVVTPASTKGTPASFPDSRPLRLSRQTAAPDAN